MPSARIKQRPAPLYRTDPDHAMAAYHYKESAGVSGGEMAEHLATY